MFDFLNVKELWITLMAVRQAELGDSLILKGTMLCMSTYQVSKLFKEEKKKRIILLLGYVFVVCLIFNGIEHTTQLVIGLNFISFFFKCNDFAVLKLSKLSINI